MDTTLDVVINEVTTVLLSLVEKASLAMIAIIGIGLTIFAVKWIVGVLKSFFVKLSGEYDGEYEDTYEYYASGRRDSDYDYDIDS